MTSAQPAPEVDPNGPLRPGAPVEVRNRFDGTWCRGFEITEVLPGVGLHRYRIRRISDGVILPRLFTEEVLRTR